MSVRNKMKGLFTIVLSVCLVVTMCPFLADCWNGSGHVEASAQKGSGDAVVECAKHYKDIVGLTAVKKAMKKRGYTLRNGSLSGPWCYWFVANCMKQAGVSTTVFPIVPAYNCDRSKYKNMRIYKKSRGWGGKYDPVAGDLIYFSWSAVDYADHIGIVRYQKNGRVYTIEGNSGNAVRYQDYSRTNKQILGYVHPNYSKKSSSSSTTTPSSGSASTLKVTSLQNIKINEGSKATINGKVASNYAITKITGTITDSNNKVVQTKTMGTSDFGKSKKSVKIAGSKVDKNLKCGNLSVGTYTLTIEAWDSKNSGSKKGTATITVNGDVKKPTIGSETPVAGGKKVVISKNSSQLNAKLCYQIGNQNTQRTSSNSVTVTVTSTSVVTAWCELNNKSSGKERKTITIPKLTVPCADPSQRGGKVSVVLLSSENAAQISYKIGNGSWVKNYKKGTLIELQDGQQIQYYAEANGYIRSDVGEFTAELTEPSTPVLKLMNAENAVAVGKSVSIGWEKDWQAESYQATLYKRIDDEKGQEVTSVETDKPTASFTLSEEGSYYVEVVASNVLGESEASKPMDVIAKGPVKVVFRDAAVDKKKADTESSDDEGDSEVENNEGVEDTGNPESEESIEEGAVIATVTVDYGEKLEKIAPPSRRGHTFIGWRNNNTGEVSENAYAQRAMKEDTTFVATYEKKKYTVRYYDPNGRFLMTDEVEFGDSAITSIVENEVKKRAEEDGGFSITGKIINWTVIKVADDDSEANVKSVDSNMHIQAVCTWEKESLPVIIDLHQANENDEIKTIYDDGDVVLRPRVQITTDESRKQEIYLIATVKGVDEESGVEKALYMDRRVFSVPTGDEGLILNESNKSHDFDLPIDPKYANAVTKIELVAVQKKQNGTTGSTYSEMAEHDVILDFGFTKPSEWSTTRPEEKDGRVITSKKQWVYRDKEYTESGYESLSGYTKERERTISDSGWSKWYKGSKSGNGETARYDKYKDIRTVVNENAYKYSCKLCKCGRTSTQTGGTLCKSCNTKTDVERKLKIFTKNKSGNVYVVGNGYYTISAEKTYGSLGYIYAITYGHSNIVGKDSYTAPVNTTFWIDNDGKTETLHREKVTRIANVFYRFKPWSNEEYVDPNSEKAWSDTEIKATSTREVKSRTLWRYRDKITTPEVVKSFDEKVKNIHGHLNVDEDLDGKKGTVMVYQANNTDPNQYQMQYTGQITFSNDDEGNKNYYNFNFIPKDDPSKSSGNYIVSIGVEGLTGLITVDTYEAPKESHHVTLCYQKESSGKDEAEEVIIAEQDVEDGADVALNGIELPDRKGYYFAGWDHSLTNITEDNCIIRAIYLPIQNAVAFVDWVNQKIDLRTAWTGEKLSLPVLDNDNESFYTFKGWKTEDGDLITDDEVTVEGNMIITAEYDPTKFTVRFVDIDGKVVDTQRIAYHESANPPSYSLPEDSGIFTGWSTDVNWWDVEEDVTVRPIIVHNEQALVPVAEVFTDEDTGERSMSLETEEAEGTIFFTTDETIPTSEMIQEYLQTEPDQYSGSIKKYTSPIIFSEDSSEESGSETASTEMEINAVTYVAGKDLSDVCYTLFEKEPDLDNVHDHEELAGWEELGEYNVKAKAGKNVQVSIDLEENPGLTGYDFLIEGDKNLFYPDVDEYGDPCVEAGTPSAQGVLMTSDLSSGWRINWNSNEVCTETGRLFTLNLHVNEQAEEGTYPIAVSLAPEYTLDENHDTTELNNVKVSVDSEACVPISTQSISLARDNYVYEGQAIEPVVRIEGLKEETDFTVKYEDNVNVGTAKAVITGIGDYAGTDVKEFTINQANIANADIAEIPDAAVTGETVEPEIPISFNGTALERDKDYEATFTENVEVGTASVAIKGIGNFKGTTEAQFNIVETVQSKLTKAEKALEEANARVAELTKAKEDAEAEARQAQAAQAAAEADAVTAREAMASAQSDAEAARLEKEQMAADLTAAQAAKTTAEAEANAARLATQAAEANVEAAQAEQRKLEAELATATTEKEATETQAALDRAAKETAEAQVVAANAAKEAAEANERAVNAAKALVELQVAQKEAELAEAVREKEALEADVNASEAERQKGEETIKELEKQLKEAQNKVNISGAVIKGVKAKTYTGKPQTQTPEVKVAGTLLHEGVDYAVNYKSNVSVGTAKMVITGVGQYAGTMEATFLINPKKTSLKKVTGGKKSLTVTWKKQGVQISGYQIRYSMKKNFKSGVNPVTAKKSATKKRLTKTLKSKKKYYVQIRTYKKVNGKTYYSSWSEAKNAVVG